MNIRVFCVFFLLFFEEISLRYFSYAWNYIQAFPIIAYFIIWLCIFLEATFNTRLCCELQAIQLNARFQCRQTYAHRKQENPYGEVTWTVIENQCWIFAVGSVSSVCVPYLLLDYDTIQSTYLRSLFMEYESFHA